MKTLKTLALVLTVLAMTATPALADSAGAASNWGLGFGAGLGAGLLVLGAGLGLGKIGGSMVESMARQPEKAGAIQTGAIIIAALLEGLAFAALFLAHVALVNKIPTP